MAVASFMIMWAALAVLCVFFALQPWRAADACARPSAEDRTAGLPLTVLCGVLLAMCGLGCAGLLKAAVWLVPGLALAALVWLGLWARRTGIKAAARLLCSCCLTPAWLTAFGGGLALAVFFACRQPLPTQWDEFSFWATAARVVKEHDTLYTLAEATNLAARSYPPALPVLGYLFGAFAPDFAPWVLYAAYGMLYFTVFGAIVGLAGPKNWPRAAFGAVLCALLPFAAESWYEHQMLVAYVTAYSDLMLGLLTAGGCAVWLGCTRADDAPLQGSAYWLALLQTALVIMVLGLTKDVGLPLGLVVMLVCLLDSFGRDFWNRKNLRALARLAGIAAVLTAAALAAYMGWAMHLQSALSVDRSETGGSAQLSTVGMVVYGVKELLGIGRTEKFAAVLSAMIGALRGIRVSVFGSAVPTVAVIYGILLLAFLLEKPGARRRPVCYGIASGLGFLGYYFFQLICYVYVFSENDGRGLVSYARYMSIYYLFWLLGAAAMLLLAVRAARRSAGIGLAAVALAVLALCTLRIDAQDTFLGRSPAAWDTQALVEARAAQVKALAGPEDKVLLVSQWDDSDRWYRYAYALEPVPLYHAVGDNTIVLPTPDAVYPLELTAETIGAFLQKEGCTLLLLDVVDYDFWTEYRALFTDDMAGFETGSCVVYRVEYQGGAVRFVPGKEAAR